MADGEMARPDENGKTPEVEEMDGFKFQSFQQGEQINTLVTTQRKRIPKRSYANFGMTTLSLSNDSGARIKKRNRKDDKRIVVDRVDGFTFISAFTLNDFDEYERNPLKRPLAPTKRKAGRKNQSATSSKKVKKADCSNPQSSGAPGAKAVEGLSNLTPKKSPPAVNEGSSKKTVSPLTKSALVRLKKISVHSLNRNNPVKKQIKAAQETSRTAIRNKTSCSKTKKSMNLTVPLVKDGGAKKPKNSEIPHMQIDKPIPGRTEVITLSDDDDDNIELDVCGVDENSSSHFILSNISKPRCIHEKSKLAQPSKAKKKLCRVCCSYPSRIVEAKRVKSDANQFPSFDVSFTSKCQVHTPGEILVNEPTQGKASVCIQTTFTDIQMHLDFARRFPYRTISVVSCEPSVCDEELKLSENLPPGTNQRCSENHRMLEQKRREELHGLYRKLADTISVSRVRASKQWILENALEEVKSLEAKNELLTAKLNSEKSENDKKRKRWEELAGKPYVGPDESRGKSKFLELYKQYRQERDRCSTMKDEENDKEEKSQERENVRKELQKKIKKSQSKKVCGKPYNKPASMLSPSSPPDNSADSELQSMTPDTNDTVKSNNSISSGAAQNSAPKNSGLGSVDNSPMTASVGEPGTKSTQPISIATVKQAPSQIVPPSQHISLNCESASTPSIPEIDLTKESSLNEPVNVIPESNPLTELSHLVARNPNLATAVSNTTAQATGKVSKDPPPNQSCAPPQAVPCPQIASTSFLTPSVQKPSLSQTVDLNMNYVVVTIVVNNKKMVFRIPKTAEGLTLLGKLSSLNVLSPDSLNKIAAQFPAKQSGQSPKTTTGLATSPVTPTPVKLIPVTPTPVTLTPATLTPATLTPATLTPATLTPATLTPVKLIPVTPTPVTLIPVTPTQWSAVVSSPSMSTTQTLQAVKQSIPSAAFTTNSSSNARLIHPIKLPIAKQLLKPNNGSFAIISRPIKVPIAKTVRTNMVTTVQTKQSNQHNTVEVESGSKVKPFNPVKPNYKVITTEQTKGSDEQPKVILFDLTKNNKAEAKPFTVIPASSSINVTLNRLGSITANKVHNKRPTTVPSQVVSSNATASTAPLPSNTTLIPTTLQKNPQNTHFVTTPKPSTSHTDQSKLPQTKPVLILPKCPAVNTPTTVENVSMCTSTIPILPSPQAPTSSDELPKELPEDLPEIPPDIPNDLTRESLSPLEKMPEMSDLLMDDKKDVNNVNDPEFCIISNVFSLTENTQSATTAKSLEKMPDSAAVGRK